MIKIITWILLAVVLLISIFIPEKSISNSQLSIMVMLLLISLLPELKEFNFWGLKGKKAEKDFKKLEGQQALSEDTVKVDHKKLDKAERETAHIQLMETSQGNFLALAFEIERLLRIFGTVGLNKNIPSTTNMKKLTTELRNANLLTESGVKQIEAIQWLRNFLVHGRQSEINQSTLDAGLEIATSLYSELNKMLYSESS